MYRYETHLHTAPVSKCAKASVRENLEFYKNLGYAGVFITNHFLDGNINIDYSASYEDKIEFYFSDYEEGVKIGRELNLSVFAGIEMSYKGTDFLVYGPDKQWFLKNPGIMEMKKSVQLPYLRDNGALVVQAHPFRQADYIDHIRLFPDCVDGVEVINAGRTELENKMAEIYAEEYALLKTAGSDNHVGREQTHLAGVETDTPIKNEKDFIEKMKKRCVGLFEMTL